MGTQENQRQMFDDCFDLFSMFVGDNYVTLYDVKRCVTRFSTAIVDMLGLPGEYIDDGSYSWTDFVHPEDRHFYEETMGGMFSMRQRTYDLSYRIRLKDGSYHMFRFVGGMIRDDAGNPSIAGGMMISSGVMENIDHVTTMRNINGFFEDLAGADAAGHYHMLLLGFGRLAHINAVYGYGYGSRILREVGAVMEAVVGSDGHVYRMDGAKFAVLSDRLSDEGMTRLYEKIRARLRDGVEIDGVRHNLVIFGGMIESHEWLESHDHLFDNAHTLYNCLLHAYKESKRYKNGELVVYNDEHGDDDALVARLATIHTVRESLHDDFDGFYLLYQPLFKAPGETPHGAQARLMWKRGEEEGLRPSQFVEELSHDAAFEKLGYWFLKKAMIDGRDFLDENPSFQLYVPIPAHFIGDRYFIDNAAEYAARAKFPLSSLSVLLTKECRLVPMEKLLQFAAYLKGKGVRLGLDDFAVGNDWLHAFRELSPDFVRFPAALTAHIAEDGKDMAIFSHLADMVKSCGTKIYVRGVVSAAVRDILCTLPIDGMQGDALMKYSYYDEVVDLYAAKNADYK